MADRHRSVRSVLFTSELPMPTYRFYTLQPDGHIAAPPRIVELSDDAAAIKYAEHCLDGSAIEVWQHARQVTRLDPRDGSHRAIGDRCG
jgi:hypothetical protein